MKEAAALVVGEHDFTSFAAVDPDRTARMNDDEGERLVTNIRQVFSSQWERTDDELIYTVRGNGFLHHMVRNLVGTFLLVGKGTLKPPDVTRILAARDRSAAGATVPGSGLYLVSVEY
jgi:tRNA pseudouridine38-40 synthase